MKNKEDPKRRGTNTPKALLFPYSEKMKNKKVYIKIKSFFPPTNEKLSVGKNINEGMKITTDQASGILNNTNSIRN